jgi:hypothetical protein
MLFWQAHKVAEIQWNWTEIDYHLGWLLHKMDNRSAAIRSAAALLGPSG